ncbi:hypothetical protein [Alkalibacillus aidingensis]|uniref:hypothetical protein n=1 Tax=Alkalibacillus aidingensis TaxID=2747607 RepID=UPI00166047C0|nr:hypothetical protein [Alkalibacillus aidingensis]
MKWVGLMLMVLAALVYWIAKYADLDPVFTNASIIFIAIGAVTMTVGVIRAKRNTST